MKTMTTALLAVALLTACANDENESSVLDGSAVKITFSVQGDFTLSTSPFTRASLEADGKSMTDIWVFDYAGTLCQQTIHQVSTDPDFGTPTLNISLGTHHLYFVATRGSGATLNTDAHTLTFGSVRDTFWKDYTITITGGTSSGSRAVALDRVVTKLKLVLSDAIPTGASTFNITPVTWYYGIDYQTGSPAAVANNQTTTVNIPSSEIGVINETVSIYGFSPSTEWTTDVSENCKTSNNTVLGSATITAAPFQRNRVTEFSGPLFGDNGAMTLSLNTAWDDSYQGTW